MIRIGEASKIIGVTPQTIRKYVNEGRLKAYHNGGNQLIFDPKDINDFIGKPNKPQPDEKIVFYIRSSNGQEASLTTQEKLLKETYGEPEKIYKDKCSGLKDSRPALNKLMKDAQKGTITKIAIAHEDRLTRFGYNYLKQYFNQNNIEILTLNHTEKLSLEEELMKDFMSLIASFSGKFYRLRGYTQQKQLLKEAKEIINKKEQNNS